MIKPLPHGLAGGSFAGLAVLTALFLIVLFDAVPCSAQYSDEYTSEVHTHPTFIQGASMGTIGPVEIEPQSEPLDGVTTQGSVRINCLASTEALLNIIANAAEVIGIVSAIVYALKGMCTPRMPDPKKQISCFLNAAAFLVLGISTPGAVNWVVASARDANLFS